MTTLISKIAAVQVYRRGATITRVAELHVEGTLPDEVELTGLPLSLLDPTVRMRVRSDEPGVDVVAAGVRVGMWVRPGDPPPKAPAQEELEEAQRQIERTGEQLELVEHELSLLRGVAVPERPQGEEGKAPPASPMAARLQLEQFVDGAAQKRLLERRTLREQLRGLQEDERRMQERIAAASSAADVHLEELQKSVVVRLRSRGTLPKKLTLELSYVVPGARWAPAYQCKLARDGSHAEIQMRAWVAQRTGEDWQGVRLKLSTASPLRFTELPELAALRIGRAQPPPAKKGFRPAPQGSEVLFRDHDRDAARAQGLLPSASAWQLPQLAAPRLPARAQPAAPTPTKGSARDSKASGRAKPGAASRRPSARAAPNDDPLGTAEGDSMMLAEPAECEEDSVAFGVSVDALPTLARSAPMMDMDARSPPAAKLAAPSERSRVPEEVVQALLYPLLRLPDAADGNRGRLMPVDVRTLYAESLARIGRPIRFDVVSAVQQAEDVALSVTSSSLPDGAVCADNISSHFDFAYEADGRVEVTGDGGFHSIALGDRQSEARMRYIAVPREELAVYRVAMLTNPIPAPLLPGPAEVYVGGEYVLTTRLPTVPARGELKLGLGVEQSIKIARNTKYQEQRTGDKVVAMTELVHDVDIDIINHLEREIEIEVRERVPVPAAGAEVVIEESKVEPAWQPYDQQERGQPIEGGRRWEVKVKPGGTQKLRGRYVVKLYANNEIAGGNRRET